MKARSVHVDPRFAVTPLPAPSAAPAAPERTPEQAAALYWSIDGGGLGGEAVDMTPGSGADEYELRVGSSRVGAGRVRRTSAPDGALSRRLASSMAAALQQLPLPARAQPPPSPPAPASPACAAPRLDTVGHRSSVSRGLSSRGIQQHVAGAPAPSASPAASDSPLCAPTAAGAASPGAISPAAATTAFVAAATPSSKAQLPPHSRLSRALGSLLFGFSRPAAPPAAQQQQQQQQQQSPATTAQRPTSNARAAAVAGVAADPPRFKAATSPVAPIERTPTSFVIVSDAAMGPDAEGALFTAAVHASCALGTAARAAPAADAGAARDSGSGGGSGALLQLLSVEHEHARKLPAGSLLVSSAGGPAQPAASGACSASATTTTTAAVVVNSTAPSTRQLVAPQSQSQPPVLSTRASAAPSLAATEPSAASATSITPPSARLSHAAPAGAAGGSLPSATVAPRRLGRGCGSLGSMGVPRGDVGSGDDDEFDGEEGAVLTIHSAEEVARGHVHHDAAASARGGGSSGSGGGAPSPTAELASVAALLAAKRRAAQSLERDVHAGSSGASLARLACDGSHLAGLLAAARSLTPAEVAASMAEIEAEQADDARARVASLSPVVLDAFEVSADVLRASLAAQARRRACLRCLCDLRRASPPPHHRWVRTAAADARGAADADSALDDDDPALVAIDGDAGGLGCGLFTGRKLRVNDEAWRKLVREAARLPAFLGVALFQRCVEAAVAVDAEAALLQRDCVRAPPTAHSGGGAAACELDRLLQPWGGTAGAGAGGGAVAPTRLGSTLSPTAVSIAHHHAHSRSFFGGASLSTSSAVHAAPHSSGSAVLAAATASGSSGHSLARSASALGMVGGGSSSNSSSGGGREPQHYPIQGAGHARTASSLARTLSASHGFGGDDVRPMSPRLRYVHGQGGGDSGAGAGAGAGTGSSSSGGGGGGGGGGDPAGWHTSILFPLNPDEAYMRRAAERVRVGVRAQVLTGTVGILDLLVVWAPSLDDAPRCDKLIALLGPPPDPLLTTLTLGARTEIRRQMRTLKRSVPAGGGGGGGGVAAPPGAVAGGGASTAASVDPAASTTAAAAAAAAADDATARVLAMARAQLRTLAAQLASGGVTHVPPPVRLVPASPDFDASYRVGASNLAPVIEALVERHPDLAPLRDKPLQRSRYLTAVLSAVFASLPQGLSLQGVPLPELRHSNLAESLWLCSTTSTVHIAPYSLRFFASLDAEFEGAAGATKLADDREAAARLAVSGPLAKGAGALRAARRSDFGFDLLVGALGLGGSGGSGGSGGGVVGVDEGSGGGGAKRPPLCAPAAGAAVAAAARADHAVDRGAQLRAATSTSTTTTTAATSSTSASALPAAALSLAEGGGTTAGSSTHRHARGLSINTAPPAAPPLTASTAPGCGGAALGSPRASRAVQKRLRMPDPDAGSDDKAVVSLAAFQRCCHVLVQHAVLERVFAGAARPLASGVRGRLAFEDYVWLMAEQSQRCTLSSQEYWLRALDLDDDGLLGLQDMAAAFAAKAAALAAGRYPAGGGGGGMPSVAEALAILLDAIDPADPAAGVSRLDLKRSGCGPILYDLLVAAGPPRSVTAASVHLRLTTSPHAQSGGCGEV